MGQRLAWWTVLLSTSVLLAVLVERAGRRLLPLVTLLKLSMLFPDRAPTRFAVARQAGSLRLLKERVVELEGRPEASTQEALGAPTILALAAALQSHDRQTRGHSERVRVFTDLLAEEMQLGGDDRHRLRWAALLHDIGKLTVDSRILNKPGSLDEDEWAVIRRHPALGARIAAPLLEWLGPWGSAIAEHHERFDGGGYPLGLAGPEISLGGRIVSVADCFDTMTAVRSYKKGMAVWAARRELARCAGTQFDPAVVRAFLGVSLPRLLWKTGPVSFLIQLPFLARLQELGQQGLSAAAQGVAAATVAAGVAATIASPAAAPSPSAVLAPRRSVPAVSTAAPRSSPSTSGTSTDGRPTPGSGSGNGNPPASPSPSPSRDPLPTPLPTISPSPTPEPSPNPLPTLPLPLPSLPLPPLPSLLPSLLPPLPIPSLPLSGESAK